MADMPGEITGGTECYGLRYYFAVIRLTSLAEMPSSLSQVAPSLVTLVSQHETALTYRPSDLLVEIE